MDTNFVSTISNVASLDFLRLQGDGKVDVFGRFATLNDGRLRSVVRLNSDGSEDTTFQFNTEISVTDAVILGDGGMIVNGTSGPSKVVRFRADGSKDPTFAPLKEFDEWISTVAIAPDGALVIGGTFSNVNGFPQSVLARFLSIPSSSRPFLRMLSAPPDELPRLLFYAPTSTTIDLQASSNLRAWTSIAIVVGSGDLQPVTESNAPTASRRFYRAVVKP